MKILLIEDDMDLAVTIKQRLSTKYLVEIEKDGEGGIYEGTTEIYDLIILDISLPDINGIEVCQAIRKHGISIPILMLTGKTEISYKVSSLDSGADDYLTKPFNFEELLARIRSLTRRAKESSITTKYSAADLIYDASAKTVERNGIKINLRRKELELLEFLLKNKGKIVTKDQLLSKAWGNDADTTANVIEVHIANLRKAIDKPFKTKLIKTLHGIGYKIQE